METLGPAGGLGGLESEGRSENRALSEAHGLGKATDAGACLLGLLDVGDQPGVGSVSGAAG